MARKKKLAAPEAAETNQRREENSAEDFRAFAIKLTKCAATLRSIAKKMGDHKVPSVLVDGGKGLRKWTLDELNRFIGNAKSSLQKKAPDPDVD